MRDSNCTDCEYASRLFPKVHLCYRAVHKLLSRTKARTDSVLLLFCSLVVILCICHVKKCTKHLKYNLKYDIYKSILKYNLWYDKIYKIFKV